MLELNPFYPALRLHKLGGSLGDLRSVSINLSYRITIEFLISDRKIIPSTSDPTTTSIDSSYS